MSDLKLRTKTFAILCWKLCAKFPKSREYSNYVNQLLRSSSSVGANYRASQRAKSKADFINKLKIVEEEIDESVYWLEIFLEISDVNHIELKELHKEATEILAIIVASINTARKNQKSKNSNL
ncbi:four helix bundle protein [Flagellimonas sp.]|uniref:four helix bundle protein n=1 Tax=Flagellimonas sp. TaxID=2058762 RepID=UPI003B50097F